MLYKCKSVYHIVLCFFPTVHMLLLAPDVVFNKFLINTLRVSLHVANGGLCQIISQSHKAVCVKQIIILLITILPKLVSRSIILLALSLLG